MKEDQMTDTPTLPTVIEILFALRDALVADPLPRNDNARAQNNTRIRVLIPRRYNDRTVVPMDETVALMSELLEKVAGGITVIDASGICVDGDGVELDEMLALEITSPNMDALIDVLERWTVRLGQRAIYVEKMTCTALHIEERATDTERVPTQRSAA